MSVDHLIAASLCGFAKLLTGVRALWLGSEPVARTRVYFANHRSHGDFVLIWASLPPALAYLWLGNAPASLLRATVMLFVVALWLTMGRPRTTLDALCAALLCSS